MRSTANSLASSQAGAVLLTEADAQGYSGNALITASPYLAYARLSHLFDVLQAVPGIHPRRWWRQMPRSTQRPALVLAW